MLVKFPKAREGRSRKDFGAWLRRTREKLGFTQAALAQKLTEGKGTRSAREKVGLSHHSTLAAKLTVGEGTVRRWENGRSRPPEESLVEFGNICFQFGFMPEALRLWKEVGLDPTRVEEALEWRAARDRRVQAGARKPPSRVRATEGHNA